MTLGRAAGRGALRATVRGAAEQGLRRAARVRPHQGRTVSPLCLCVMLIHVGELEGAAHALAPCKKLQRKKGEEEEEARALAAEPRKGGGVSLETAAAGWLSPLRGRGRSGRPAVPAGCARHAPRRGRGHVNEGAGRAQFRGRRCLQVRRRGVRPGRGARGPSRGARRGARRSAAFARRLRGSLAGIRRLCCSGAEAACGCGTPGFGPRSFFTGSSGERRGAAPRRALRRGRAPRASTRGGAGPRRCWSRRSAVSLRAKFPS